jgi:hypothetical protein
MKDKKPEPDKQDYVGKDVKINKVYTDKDIHTLLGRSLERQVDRGDEEEREGDEPFFTVRGGTVKDDITLEIESFDNLGSDLVDVVEYIKKALK